MPHHSSLLVESFAFLVALGWVHSSGALCQSEKLCCTQTCHLPGVPVNHVYPFLPKTCAQLAVNPWSDLALFLDLTTSLLRALSNQSTHSEILPPTNETVYVSLFQCVCHNKIYGFVYEIHRHFELSSQFAAQLFLVQKTVIWEKLWYFRIISKQRNDSFFLSYHGRSSIGSHRNQILQVDGFAWSTKKNIKAAWMSCPWVWPVSGNKASISSENVSPLGMRTQTTS